MEALPGFPLQLPASGLDAYYGSEVRQRCPDSQRHGGGQVRQYNGTTFFGLSRCAGVAGHPHCR